MALSPLPVEKIPDTKQDKAAFPYPKLGAGPKQQTPLNKPAMRPLLAKPTSDSTPALSQEKKRMLELESMLNEAQNRAAVAEQEAYDKAYAAGEKAGLVLGEKRAEQMLESMQEILLKAEQALQNIQQQSSESILDIATALAEFVIGSLDKDQQSNLLLTTQKAAEQFAADLTEVDKLIFSVHPDDLTIMARMCEDYPLHKLVVGKNIEQGTCQLSSHKHDALIDPIQVLRKGVQHIREQLLAHHD